LSSPTWMAVAISRRPRRVGRQQCGNLAISPCAWKRCRIRRTFGHAGASVASRRPAGSYRGRSAGHLRRARGAEVAYEGFVALRAFMWVRSPRNWPVARCTTRPKMGISTGLSPVMSGRFSRVSPLGGAGHCCELTNRANRFCGMETLTLEGSGNCEVREWDAQAGRLPRACQLSANGPVGFWWVLARRGNRRIGA